MADHVYNTRRRNIKQKEALEEESDDSIDDSTTSLDNSDSKLPKRRGRPSKKSDSKKSRTQSNKTSMKPKKNPKKVKVTSKENTDYAALVQKNIEERNAIFASLFRDLAVGETKNIEKNKKKIQRQMPDNEKTENEPPKKRVKIWRKVSKSVSETSSSNLEDEVIPKYNTRSRNKEIPRRNMKELDSEDSFSEKFPSLSDSGDSSFLVNGISDRDWISVRDVGPMTRKQLMLQKKLIATEEDNGNKGNLEATITSQPEENAKENEEQKADEKESHAMDECPSFTSSKISTTDDEANSKDQTYEPSLSSQEEINENTDIVKAVIISQPEENGQKNEQQNADEKESHAMDENSSFTSSKTSATDEEANSKDQKTHEPSISGQEEINENTDIVKLNENDANVSSADVNNEENIVEQIDAINPDNEKVEVENKVEIDTEKPDDKKEVM